MLCRPSYDISQTGLDPLDTTAQKWKQFYASDDYSRVTIVQSERSQPNLVTSIQLTAESDVPSAIPRDSAALTGPAAVPAVMASAKTSSQVLDKNNTCPRTADDKRDEVTGLLKNTTNVLTLIRCLQIHWSNKNGVLQMNRKLYGQTDNSKLLSESSDEEELTNAPQVTRLYICYNCSCLMLYPLLLSRIKIPACYSSECMLRVDKQA